MDADSDYANTPAAPHAEPDYTRQIALNMALNCSMNENGEAIVAKAKLFEAYLKG